MKGWTTNTIPDAAKVRMSREQRASLGKAGRTTAEIDAQNEIKSERELQNQIAGYLRCRGAYFVSQRMDKRARLKVGTPDFLVCFEGYFVAFEVKFGSGVLSAEQDIVLQDIEKCGGQVAVVKSLQQVKEILDRIEEE